MSFEKKSKVLSGSDGSFPGLLNIQIELFTYEKTFLGDQQGLHVRSTFQLSLRALGGIIW
jgi:hypothetical protein